VGAEGIEARHGVELLVADVPADFAARCAELMKRPALRRRLVESAAAFVAARHSPRALLERLRRSRRPARTPQARGVTRRGDLMIATSSEPCGPARDTDGPR
jgi:hypothetical protein